MDVRGFGRERDTWCPQVAAQERGVRPVMAAVAFAVVSAVVSAFAGTGR